MGRSGPACSSFVHGHERVLSSILQQQLFIGNARPMGVMFRVKASLPIAVSPSRSTTVPEIIEALIAGQDLSELQMQSIMLDLLSHGDVAQISAILVLLRAKEETFQEISGLARAMLNLCIPVEWLGDAFDIVGTGGDGANTINISTAACILAAACGGKVAKHGNRSSSSSCGSADVLEALGVAIDLGPKGVARCVNEVGVGFMMAPNYHPAMKVVAPIRRSLKVKTVFNILGPMLNPARVPYAVVGVYDPSLVMKMARALQKFGLKRALVVHSDGLDEISPLGPSSLMEVTSHGVREILIDPLDHQIARCKLEDLKGGDPQFNAKTLRVVLEGKRGPIADALILNAAAGLFVSGKVKDFGEGISFARETHQSGRCLKILDAWIELSQKIKQEDKTIS